MRNIGLVILISALSLAGGCGGGSSSSTGSGNTGGTGGGGTSPGGTSTAGGNTIATPGNNVAPLIVDAGPVAGEATTNVPYTTVVVCAPGTTNCVTIDHVSVDTGSTGLRIPASLDSRHGQFARENVNTGAPVAECVAFLDGTFFWGTVKSADVKMGGTSNNSEVASIGADPRGGRSLGANGTGRLHGNGGGYSRSIGREWPARGRQLSV